MGPPLKILILLALARINTIIKAETTADQWNFRIGEILDKYRTRLTELGVKIISIHPQNAHRDVERYASWFLADMVHLNRRGHWHVARLILSYLRVETTVSAIVDRVDETTILI